MELGIELYPEFKSIFLSFVFHFERGEFEEEEKGIFYRFSYWFRQFFFVVIEELMEFDIEFSPDS